MNEKFALSTIKKIVLDINPEDIINDAKDYGLNISEVKNLNFKNINYVHIEVLMNKYAELTSKYCALSGASSGIGGFTTTLTLGGVDILHMAAQLYRLNQKMAVLNGFSLDNTIHKEKAQFIYLKALGFDSAAQSAIRSQVSIAILENTGKSGPANNVTIRLMMEVAKLLGVKLTKKQAVKLVPILGAALGSGFNYIFAKNAAKQMISEYKSDFLCKIKESCA